MKNLVKYMFVFALITLSFVAQASITDGTIDDTYKSALLCTTGNCATSAQINFKPTLGTAIHITDTTVTGNAWSETFGWINMNPTQGGVTNTSSGTLGGYAWGNGAGWINFAPTQGGVTINSSGEFAGYAWSANYGWIRFDCTITNACVKTDWRPLASRPSTSTSSGSQGGSSAPVTPVTPVVTSPVPPVVHPTTPGTTTPKPSGNPPPEPTAPPVISEIPPALPPVVPPEVSPTPTPNPTITPIKNFIDYIGDVASTMFSQAFGGTFIEDINYNIYDSFNIAKEIIKKLISQISDIMNTPTGSISTKAMATLGALVGSYIGVTTALFANPITFSEIALIPFRLWSLLLIAFGLKKKNRPWGTVYDSVTKQPIDPAYVVLQDMEGNEIATCITDLDGRYGFLVPIGRYRLLANKTNYEFPSKKLRGQQNDELYSDLYFDEIIEVTEDGGVINKNIPMDPLNFDWNEFAKRDQKLMKFFSKRDILINKISNTLFVIGFIVSITALIVSPSNYNIIIFAVYIVLLVLKNTIIKPRPFGNIWHREGGVPLPFAIMRVFSKEIDKEVSHKVADKNGKYYCLVPNGRYYIKIENKNVDASYTTVHTSDTIEVKEGYINDKFRV